MTNAGAEAAVAFFGLGISLLFLAFALCMFLDELKDYLLDKIQEKREKLKNLESTKDYQVSDKETLRPIILEMRSSKDPYVRELEKRICQALNRDCYCTWCGRTLGHKPSEEFYDKETGEPKDPTDKNGLTKKVGESNE